MKTKSFISGIAIAVVAVIGLCSFTSLNSTHDEIVIGVRTHVHAQGSRCKGTVGCSCPGFSAITNGDVWQKAYCRHCGHKRSVHK